MLASTSMFPGSINPTYGKLNVLRIVSPHQNGPWDATLWNVVAITAMCSSKCYYFEWYSVLCPINNYHSVQHCTGLSGMSKCSLYSHDNRPTNISQT